MELSVTARQLAILKKLSSARFGRMTAEQLSGRPGAEIDVCLLRDPKSASPASLVGMGLVAVVMASGHEPQYTVTAKGYKLLKEHV